MVEMLKQVILVGTGKAANIGRPVAGKTGTTDSYRDAWFIGFTPDVLQVYGLDAIITYPLKA